MAHRGKAKLRIRSSSLNEQEGCKCHKYIAMHAACRISILYSRGDLGGAGGENWIGYRVVVSY